MHKQPCEQITQVHAIGWNQAIGKTALIIDTRSSVFVILQSMKFVQYMCVCM